MVSDSPGLPAKVTEVQRGANVLGSNRCLWGGTAFGVRKEVVKERGCARGI